MFPTIGRFGRLIVGSIAIGNICACTYIHCIVSMMAVHK